MPTQRILLYSSKVGEDARAYFLGAASVTPVIYDWDRTASFTDLLESVYLAAQAFPKRTRVLSVGIMYHNEVKNTLKCFAQDQMRSTCAQSTNDFSDFLAFVRVLKLLFDIADVDIISCSVVDQTQGTRLNGLCAQLGGTVNINASIKNEGAGGNWVLEEPARVDMVNRYFNSKIRKSGIVMMSVSSGLVSQPLQLQYTVYAIIANLNPKYCISSTTVTYDASSTCIGQLGYNLFMANNFSWGNKAYVMVSGDPNNTHYWVSSKWDEKNNPYLRDTLLATQLLQSPTAQLTVKVYYAAYP